MKELQKKNKKSAHHLLQWPLLLGKRRIVPEWKLRAYPQIAFPFPFVKERGRGGIQYAILGEIPLSPPLRRGTLQAGIIYG